MVSGANSPWQYCGTGVSPVVFTLENAVSNPLFALSPRAANHLSALLVGLAVRLGREFIQPSVFIMGGLIWIVPAVAAQTRQRLGRQGERNRA